MSDSHLATISGITTVELSSTDRLSIRKQLSLVLSFTIPAYLLTLAGCLFFLTRDKESYNIDNKTMWLHFSDSEAETLGKTVPLICYAIILLATFYFVTIYIKKVHPLLTDLKSNIKTICYFWVTNHTIAIANCLHLPLKKTKVVHVTKQSYKLIVPNDELCIEQTLSGLIICIKKGDKDILRLGIRRPN